MARILSDRVCKQLPPGFDLRNWCSFQQTQEIPLDSFVGNDSGKREIVSPYLVQMNSAYWQKVAEDGCGGERSDAELRFAIGEAVYWLATKSDDAEDESFLSRMWSGAKDLFGIKEAHALEPITTVFAILAILSFACVIKKPAGPWDEDGGSPPPDGRTGDVRSFTDGKLPPPDARENDMPDYADGGVSDSGGDASKPDAGVPPGDAGVSDFGNDAQPSDAGRDAGETEPDAGGLPGDIDGDGIEDEIDNCPTRSNPDQLDFDDDETGDACDDSDGDGFNDEIEIGRDVSNPRDTDGDGIVNALDTDDDNDGIPTSHEGRINTDGDSLPDYLDPDDDGDGLLTADEIALGSNSLDPDTDGDGITDRTEVANPSSPRDTDGDGTWDVFDTDDDGDGLPTRDENRIGTNPWNPDFDGDGLSDGVEVGGDTTRPMDTDGDTIINAFDTDDDGDGIRTAAELAIGTDPLLRDSDSDGMDDPAEVGGDVSHPLNTDGDGQINALDEDSDNDGAPDRTDNCYAIPNSAQSDIDADGLGDACDDDADGDGHNALMAGGDDCNDLNAMVNPDAEEIVCDGDDNDCNTLATPDVVDADEDGFLCDEECDDARDAVNPYAEEIEGDDVDNNCDGYELAWTRETNVSASGYDTIISLAPDDADGAWVAGYASVTGEDYNAWCDYVDADGNFLSRWMNSGAAAAGRDFALGIVLDPVRNELTIAGQHTAATRDAVLWRTRAETPLPAPTITHRIDGAAASEDMANDVLALDDGSVITISSITTRVISGTRDVDIDIRRVSADGSSVLWNLSFAGEGIGQEKGLGLAWRPGSEVFYAAGRMAIAGGQMRLWLAAININGTVIWQRTYPDIEPRDSQNAKRIVAIAPDGTLHVVAEEGGPPSDTDAYLYTFNPANGNPTDDDDISPRLQLMATDGNDWSNGIVVDAEGRRIIAGASTVPGQAANASLMIVDRDDNVLWHRMHIGPANLNDIYTAASIGESGRIFVSGYINANPPSTGDSIIMALDPLPAP